MSSVGVLPSTGILAMSTRDIVTAGLADVAHCVADAPYLAAIMAAALAEREAQMRAGLMLLECVRVTARYHPELRAILNLGEQVFGEGI